MERWGPSILISVKDYRLVLLFILTGTFLIPVNSTMIAVGLTAIANDFGIEIGQVTWVVTIYLIIMAALQPVTGKLGDLYGKRNMYLIGMLLFLSGSVACIYSLDVISLILFRAIQALGGALLSPNAMALIREIVPADKLAQTFGTYGSLMGLGAAIGPLLGAGLIGWWGWSSLFWINIPFALFSLVVAFLHLPMSSLRREPTLDIFGAICLITGFTLLVLFVTHPQMIEWWLVIVFILIVSLFLKTELRHPEPIIQFRLFKIVPFRSANVAILLSNAIMYSTILLMPILLQEVHHFSLQSVGMLLFLFSLSMSTSSWFGGKLTNRVGPKWLILLSFIIFLLALLGYVAIDRYPNLFFIGAVLLVGGFGAGIGSSSMQVTSLQAVSVEMSGVASGIYSTFRYIGGIIASVFVSVIVDAHLLIYCLMILAIFGVITSNGIALHTKSKLEVNNK